MHYTTFALAVITLTFGGTSDADSPTASQTDRRLLGGWASYRQSSSKRLQLVGDGSYFFGDSVLSISRQGQWAVNETRITFDGKTVCNFEFNPNDHANNMWINVSCPDGSPYSDRWWRKIVE